MEFSLTKHYCKHKQPKSKYVLWMKIELSLTYQLFSINIFKKFGMWKRMILWRILFFAMAQAIVSDNVVFSLVRIFISMLSWKDFILKYLIFISGSLISEMLPGRTGKQCRERWLNHLGDGIKKGQWSEDEDRLITTMRLAIGNQWCKVSRFHYINIIIDIYISIITISLYLYIDYQDVTRSYR